MPPAKSKRSTPTREKTAAASASSSRTLKDLGVREAAKIRGGADIAKPRTVTVPNLSYKVIIPCV